jgi:glycosyltransferase involved in cell wall biosynthesis
MKESPRILIVSNGPLCRNPRVVKEAATLGAAGYRVTVLTVRDHAPSEIQDVRLLAAAPFRRVTIDLLPDVGTAGSVVFLRRLQLWAARKLSRLSWLRSIHALGPAAALLAAARRLPAELTIVHNEIAHWVGTRLLEDGRLVAADIEDWHSEDLLPDARRHRPLPLLRAVERTLLRHAVHTTTTSHALSAALHARYGGRAPVVISNSFPLQPDFRQAPANPPAFFWFSQTLGPGRGLEPFVAAWSRMQVPSRLVLLGASAGNFCDQLRQSVPGELCARLEFLDLVPASDLPALIARHDIGLALELAEIPNRDLTVTNKILQYLNAGLAIVATATQGQREVLAPAPEAGLFVDLDDPSALARELDTLIADPAQLAARQAAARQLAATHYCWELDAPRLCALVSAALAGVRSE